MQFNLADLFECVVDHVPDRVALVCGDRRVTYAELEGRSNQVAHALLSLGVDPGSHVGCYLHNGIEHVETMLGCYKVRAVPININYRYVEDELAYVCADADVIVLVHDADLSARVAAVKDRIPGLRATVEVGPSYEALVERASAGRDFGARSPDDHYILYTGGTTGLPKGVVWRQEDIFFAAVGGGNPGGPPIDRPERIGPGAVTNRNQRLGPMLPPGDPGPGEFVTLSLGPLIHASGQWGAFGTLLGGGTLVLNPDRHMDMARVLDLVEHERVGMLTLVGDASARPLLDALEADAGAHDTSSLRLLGSGGSILSGDVKQRLLAELPSVAAILEAIGSSESPAQAVSIATQDDGVAPSLTFASKPETIVVDDDLVPIPPGTGTIGRLATRGRVPLGYWKDPERTARTFVEIDGDRWSMPGDMATVDADGTVHLLGRGSLCINTGGEKVYPEEVEAVLKSHPHVADAVVIGLPDAEWGERVVAVAQPRPGEALTLDDLQEHARAHLAGYKVPRALHVVDEVRRSPAGKADYAWARDVASSDH